MTLDECLTSCEQTQHVDLGINSVAITSESERLKPLTDELKNIPAVTLEDYFGKNKNVEKIILKFQQLKPIFQSKIGKLIDKWDINKINPILAELDEIIAQMINVESVTVQLIPGSAIYSFPIGMGVIDLSKFENMTDKEAMAEYNAYTTDANGVSYKYRDGKHLIIYLGTTVLANPDMQPEFITALLFREIGRSFLNYTYGYSIQFQRCVIGAEDTLDIFTKFEFIFDQIKTIKGFTDEYDLKAMWEFIRDYFQKDNHTEEDDILMSSLAMEFGKKLGRGTSFFIGFVRNVIGFVKSIPQLFSRLLFKGKEESQKERKKRCNDILNMKVETADESQSMFRDMIGQAFDVYNMIATLYLSGFSTFSKILMLNPFDLTAINALISDTGADKFPGYYGLGTEFAKAMLIYDKITRADERETAGFAKLFKKVPLMNILTQLPLLITNTIDGLSTGTLSTRVKIKRLHTQLSKELNNPALTPKMKRDLQNQLKNIETIYNDYIDPAKQNEKNNSARCFMYYVFRYFIKLKKTDIGSKIKDPSVNSLVSVDVWRNAKDLKDILKIDQQTDNAVTSVIEKTPIISTESLDVLDQEIVVKPHFEDSSVYLPLNGITAESYFGQTPIIKKSIKHVHEIREMFPKAKGKLTDIQKADLKAILTTWSNELAEEFNAESCYIGLEDIYNAYAYPMNVGSIKEVSAMSKNKVIETNTGYKFENKSGVQLIICLGFQLLKDISLSDEAVTAVLFHEIGHGFQQYTGLTVRKSQIYSIYGEFMGSLKNLVYTICNFNISAAIGMVISIVYNLFTGFGFLKSRKSYKDDLKKSSDKTIDNIKISQDNNDAKRAKGMHIKFFAGVISLIQEAIATIFTYIPIPGVSSFIITVVSDPLILVDLIFRGDYYQRLKTNEKFADSFATKYGLGQDLSKFMQVLYNNDFDNATKIPLLRSIEQFNMYGAIVMLSLVEAHPGNIARVKNMKDTLQNELVNNKDLPQSMRLKIQNELDEIDSTYKEMTDVSYNMKNGRRGVGVVMWVFRTFTKLKENCKSVDEFTAPISANKAAVTNALVSSFKSGNEIGKCLELTTKDVTDYLNQNQLLTNELLSDELF